MDPLTLALSIVDKSLALALIVIADIPKERREEHWKRTFDFWDRILAALPKPPQG